MSLPCKGGDRGSGTAARPALPRSRAGRGIPLSSQRSQRCPGPLTQQHERLPSLPSLPPCSFEGASPGGMEEQPLRFPHCLSPSLPLGSVGRDGSQVSVLPASPACLLRSAPPHPNTHSQVSAYTPRTRGHARACCLF